MDNKTTYQLTIGFDGKSAATTKQLVAAWLTCHGEESFVEGVFDPGDLNKDYETIVEDTAPFSVFKYEEEPLQELATELVREFGDHIQLSRDTLVTRDWQLGWRDSFQPVRTNRFVVCAPWHDREQDEEPRMPLVIDPGIAFGTGQHETTQLCLRALEKHLSEDFALSDVRALDVGCGSGILSIALAKLGVGRIVATDVDSDAVFATKENIERNDMGGSEVLVQQGSVPMGSEHYDIIVANILAVILMELLPDLAKALSTKGRLLLSGVISEDMDWFLRAISDSGLEVIDQHHYNGWVAIWVRCRR